MRALRAQQLDERGTYPSRGPYDKTPQGGGSLVSACCIVVGNGRGRQGCIFDHSGCYEGRHDKRSCLGKAERSGGIEVAVGLSSDNIFAEGTLLMLEGQKVHPAHAVSDLDRRDRRTYGLHDACEVRAADQWFGLRRCLDLQKAHSSPKAALAHVDVVDVDSRRGHADQHLFLLERGCVRTGHLCELKFVGKCAYGWKVCDNHCSHRRACHQARLCFSPVLLPQGCFKAAESSNIELPSPLAVRLCFAPGGKGLSQPSGDEGRKKKRRCNGDRRSLQY
mmetsp:Transcript_29014/g.67853  ORF Transcript_29014/g.67853 Transcript_29014/m.67853 type:complete len:278 (-) Transcript_29014:11-844(-)